jgi:hypothetical protein
LEEIIFENFNIFENNIVSVKLVKVLRYPDSVKPIRLLWGSGTIHELKGNWISVGQMNILGKVGHLKNRAND